MNSPKILLVYDKECPVCNAYCRMARIRESVGELRLVDAREASAVVDEITLKGLDIDQGMVLKVENNLYYGSDAIHALSLMSSRSGIFNRINYWIFRSHQLSLFFYPILRACRNLLLKILGKTKINNLKVENNDRF
jgi:predicted DCC family thiol-disulfide oxidoreductase YuxK